jgi:uncharacterized membrane protein
MDVKPRQQVKALAREAIRGQRGTSVFILFMCMLLLSAWAIVLGMVTRTMGTRVPDIYNPGQYTVHMDLTGWALYNTVYIAGMFLFLAIMVNLFGEYIKIYKREKAGAGALFSELTVNFWRKIGGMLWMSLWHTLWTLLLIIPGIIKSLAYFFTPYILADCPNVTARQALKISMRITNGYKGDVFVFVMSWIGWYLLSVLTFGILLIVYVGPYYYTAQAGLYLELRDKALADGRITPEDLGMQGPQEAKRSWDPEIGR